MTGWAVDLTAQIDVLDELRGAPERLAILLALPDGHELRVVDRVALEPAHVESRGWHVQLTDDGQQHVLMHATSTTHWLVEAHSHGRFGDPARFSPTDIDGLELWVPHLRWRLPERGYAALVVGPTTIDGLLWIPDRETPAAIDQIRTPRTALTTTRLSYDDWTRLRHG